MLLLYRDYSGAEIQAAVDLALANHLSSSAGVKHILLHTQAAPTPTPLDHWPATVLPDVSLYGQLGVVP